MFTVDVKQQYNNTTKINTCLLATVLCLIPEMFTGARKKKQKKREMDRKLVASYFTVKPTDIFCTDVHRVEMEVGFEQIIINCYYL